MVLEFNVQNQIIKRTDKNRVVAKSKNYLYAHFTFSEDWQDAGSITALFKNEDNETYAQILDEKGKCKVPWEVLDKAGELSVSCFGNDLITVNRCYVIIEESGYEEGKTPVEPTPTVYEQIIERLDDISSKVGFNAKIVSKLPVRGENNIIYLIKVSEKTKNLYDEYIWVNEKFEQIGSTQVDLSAYEKTVDVDRKIAELDSKKQNKLSNDQIANINDVPYKQSKFVNILTRDTNFGQLESGIYTAKTDVIVKFEDRDLYMNGALLIVEGIYGNYSAIYINNNEVVKLSKEGTIYLFEEYIDEGTLVNILQEKQDLLSEINAGENINITIVDGIPKISSTGGGGDVTKAYVDEELNKKQDKLSKEQLDNIADVPNKANTSDLDKVEYTYVDDEGNENTGTVIDLIAEIINQGKLIEDKQETLIAGDNISIVGNVISALGGTNEFNHITEDIQFTDIPIGASISDGECVLSTSGGLELVVMQGTLILKSRFGYATVFSGEGTCEINDASTQDEYDNGDYFHLTQREFNNLFSIKQLGGTSKSPEFINLDNGTYLITRSTATKRYVKFVEDGEGYELPNTYSMLFIKDGAITFINGSDVLHFNSADDTSIDDCRMMRAKDVQSMIDASIGTVLGGAY